jgi:hypothetical protein
MPFWLLFVFFGLLVTVKRWIQEGWNIWHVWASVGLIAAGSTLIASAMAPVENDPAR